MSPLFATWSGGGSELVPVMRALSIAVWVFPVMGVIRGFFQGNNEMAPYAISQVVEQVARVFYMLLSAFIIMKVMNGDYVAAVVQGTFAAFVGMVAAMGVLLYYYFKSRPVYQALERDYGVENLQPDAKDLFVETIRQAIPFIIVSSGVQLFKIVDQMTFSNFMTTFTNYSRMDLVKLFALMTGNPDKLTMVIVAFSSSISLSALPLITENWTLQKKRELATLVSNTLQLFFFVMLPAVFGMLALAYPLNTLFYEPSKLGSSLLIWGTIQAIFLGLYMLSVQMLQGIYQNRIAVQYLLVGLVVKIIVQLPLIRLFEAYGPLLATMIGFAVSNYLILAKLHEQTHFNKKKVMKRILLILILSLMMFVVTLIFRFLLGLFIPVDHKITAFILILLVMAIGVVVYGYLALSSRLADKLLGSRVDGIRRRVENFSLGEVKLPKISLPKKHHGENDDDVVSTGGEYPRLVVNRSKDNDEENEKED
jgi:O-antigen/teichoic acid export membrane protein